MRAAVGAISAIGLALLGVSGCAEAPSRLPARPVLPAPHGAPLPEPYRPEPLQPAPLRPVPPPPGPPRQAPAAPPPIAAESPPPATAWSRLQGWAEEDHAAGLRAFQSGCGVASAAPLKRACAAARALGRADGPVARQFLETSFRPEPVAAEGVLTAYFAPAYPARAAPEPPFTAPVRSRPADLFVVDLGQLEPAMAGRRLSARLADGALTPYPDRAGIETRPPPEPPLAFMRPADLFFLQIQGSGVLTFPDGRRLKAAYAGDNGRPFVAIARPMVEAGLLARDAASADTIRAWLASHAGPEAEAMMRRNPRYVFFSLAADDGREPPGAAGVPLTPGRSIAVDPARHAYGELFWIEASAPVLAGAQRTYRRLVTALDTGAAIRGEVRADLYTGSGDAAGREAGRVRHTLKMVRLVPIEPTTTAEARDEAHLTP